VHQLEGHHQEGKVMSKPSDPRAAGMAKMQEVYGFTVDPADLPGRYTDITVDHLFGTVWTDDTIDLVQRRLLTIGVLAAQDKPELLEMQFDSALERGELTVEQVREVVVHLTHYVGWPISTGMSGAAETTIRRRAQAAADATDG
jgi:4-carboxymuconolactone decarboxylase